MMSIDEKRQHLYAEMAKAMKAMHDATEVFDAAHLEAMSAREEYDKARYAFLSHKLRFG
jgi:hypothetical protein